MTSMPHPARRFLSDAAEEMDWWTIMTAEVTAFAAYYYGHSVLLAVVSGLSVLAVRVIAARFSTADGGAPIPVEPTRHRPKTSLVIGIEEDLRAELSVEAISRKRMVTERYVREVRDEMRPKAPPDERMKGTTPVLTAHPGPGRWYDKPLVRGTGVATGLVAFLLKLPEIYDYVRRFAELVSGIFGWA